MEYGATLLGTKNMEAAKRFYMELMGLSITMDLGPNVTFAGNLALQEYETWKGFVNARDEDIHFGGRDFELVFEEEDLDAFLQKLEDWPQVERVHEVREYPWGQRVIRLLDPDRHVVEVGESMKVVIQRFLKAGKTVEEVLEITMFPRPFVEACWAELEAE